MHPASTLLHCLHQPDVTACMLTHGCCTMHEAFLRHLLSERGSNSVVQPDSFGHYLLGSLQHRTKICSRTSGRSALLMSRTRHGLTPILLAQIFEQNGRQLWANPFQEALGNVVNAIQSDFHPWSLLRWGLDLPGPGSECCCVLCLWLCA